MVEEAILYLGSPGDVRSALLEVGGRPLAFRTIMTALRAGIRRVAIPAVFRNTALERALARSPAARRAAVTWLAPGCARSPGPVLLLPASTLASADAVAALASAAPPAVVMLPNGLGVALAAVGPPLADQVWQDVTAGAPVGDWLSRALTAARARVVSPSEPCVRIGGPSDGQAAEARLYAALGSQIDTRLDRLVHRRLSRPITWRAVRWGLKPNHLTLASLGLGLGAAWCVGFAGALGMLAGIVLYAGSVILDHADGDLARLTLAESRVGEWLDVAVDTVVHALLVVAMGASAESAGARVGLTAGSIGALGVVASAGVAKTWPPSGRRGVGAVLQGLSNRNAFYGLLLVFGLGQVFLPVSLPLIIALAAAGMHAYWLGAVAHRLLARGREDAEARPRPGAPGAR